MTLEKMDDTRYHLTMARLTEQDRYIRARWKKFLSFLVGKGAKHECPVSLPALHDKLNDMRKRGGDNRAELYAYLSASQTPRAQAVFDIGEALNELGIAWCSGPTALYAAGYLADWIRVLGNLRSDSAIGRWVPPLLAVYTPFAVMVAGWLREDMDDDIFLALQYGRERVVSATAPVNPEFFRWAFEAEPREIYYLGLAPIEEMARGTKDIAAVEPLVLGALREWAISIVEAKRRDVIAKDVLYFQARRVHTITSSAEQLQEFVRQVMQNPMESNQ
jgi:hypothetical protein